jgi:Tfp pilus assembly PilM family ATPase
MLVQTRNTSAPRKHRLKNRQVGIDFGTSSCKLILAEAHGSQMAITSFAKFDIPAEDPLQSGYLREQLQAWMWEHDLFQQAFVCCLPAPFTEYKSIEIPNGSAEAQARFIHQAIQTQVGSDDLHRACDYWVTNQTLHLSWTHPAFVESLIKEASTAGLLCDVIDAAPCMLARISQWQREAPGNTLVVDLGASGATFVWVKDQKALYVRRVRNLAFNPILLEMAHSVGIAPAELTCLLPELNWITAGAAGIAGPACESTLLPWLQNLQLEITRTCTYLRQRGETTHHARILLCGGASQMCGMSDWLTAKLGTSVEKVTLPADWQWKASRRYEHAAAGAIALATLGGIE